MYYAMLSLLTESVHRAATSCSAGFSGCRHFQELDNNMCFKFLLDS